MKYFYTLIVLLLSLSTIAQPPGSGYALDFDGSSDDVLIKDNKMLNPTDAITVEAWINPDAFAKNYFDNTIFGKHNWAKGNRGYVLRCGDGGKLNFNLSFKGTWVEVSSPALLNTGEWQHVAGVFDGDSIMVYINGVKVGNYTQSGSIETSSGFTAKIGELSTGTGRNFDGKIDDVRVWDTDLSEKMIRDYMCKKVDSKHPAYKHLALHYKMDEGKGSTTDDLGGGNSDGSISGAKWVRSGAPIGDLSTHDYTSTKVSMTSVYGDVFKAYQFTGSPDNVHLYYVGDTTDADPSKGIIADFDSSHYWGLFVAGSSSSTFNINYNYGKLAMVTSANECGVELFTKSGPDQTAWADFSAKSYLAGDSIARNGSKSGEFVLGFYGIDRNIRTSSGDSTACADDNLLLSAPGNSTFHYQWYKDGKSLKNDTNSRYLVKGSGKYKVDVQRSAICQYTTREMAVTILSSPTVNIPQPNGICENKDSLWLTGATPKGGNFFGKGLIKDSLFSPSSVLAGTYEIRYEFKDKKGCLGKDTIQVEVFGLPKVSFVSTQGLCNSEDSVKLTEGRPIGGTYSGKGVLRNQFFPALTNKTTGILPIKYAYTDSKGCMNSASYNIKLLGATPISFPTVDTVCLNSGLLTLKGFPFGGTYSGKGTSGNKFDPLAAGVGIHKVEYEFTNIDNCTSDDSTTVVVNGIPTVSMFKADSTCVNGGRITLNGASPSGGMYLGTGVLSLDQFDPKITGTTTTTIAYVFEDKNGCSDTAEGTMKVLDTTALKIAKTPIICVNEVPLDLAKYATPSGGTFNGKGVLKNKFDPKVAGSGIHSIAYTYTNASGCASSTNYIQEVFTLGKAKLTLPAEICENADSFQIVNASPSGGAFSGSGVKGDYFNPNRAKKGNHTIYYNTEDSNSCKISTSADIEVLALPEVNLDFNASHCDSETSYTLEGGMPKGGEYYLDNLVTTTFSPKGRGVGSYQIVYSYTDAKGCNNEASKAVIVNETPAIPTIDVDTTSLTSSATTGNQWYNKAGEISGATSAIFKPAKRGEYYVVVTSDSGCTAQSETVLFENLGVGQLSANAISIYPNPMHEVVNIQADQLKQAKLFIYSGEGKLIYQSSIQNNLQVNTANWQPGVYYAKVICLNGTLSQKIIKE